MSRICDFCWNATGQPVPAVTNVGIGPAGEPDEVWDACQSCAASVKEMLNTPKEEKKSGPGRPRKVA